MKKTIILLSILLIILILAAIGCFVSAMFFINGAVKIEATRGLFILYALSFLAGTAFCVFLSVLTAGSISEHRQIADDVLKAQKDIAKLFQQTSKQGSDLRSMKDKQEEEKKKTSKLVNQIYNQTASPSSDNSPKPIVPIEEKQTEDGKEISVSMMGVSLKSDKLYINSESFEYKDLKNVAAIGAEVRFFIDKVMYRIHCVSSSDAGRYFEAIISRQKNNDK